MNQTFSTSFLPVLIFCCAVVVIIADSGRALAQPRSIQSFVEQKNKWADLEGTTWNLEGRYSIFADKVMRFEKCPLKFVLDGDITRPLSKSTVVEVSGRLDRQDGALVFKVTSLKPRPSDLDRVVLMRTAIDTTNPEDWYDIADWAKARGEFYEDKELHAVAAELYQNGLRTEHRAIKPGDDEALFQLVKKGQSLGIDPALLTTITHEGLRVQYARIKKNRSGPADWSSLSDRILRGLSGASKRLEEFPEELAKAYANDPLKVYRKADVRQRKILDRVFYIDVMLSRILTEAQDDGSNGFEIARKLAENIPERMDLAADYREKELQYRIEHVDVVARNQMLDLVKLFESMEDEDRAILVKRKWLKARELLYQDLGARELVELGNDWIQLLKDEKTAARFYMEAWKKNPEYPAAIQWLKDNGYVLVNRTWLPAEDAPETSDVKMQLAIKEGRVIVGMTQEQVRSAMGIRPDTTTRFATTGKITELWVYESAGIVIRLSRRNRIEDSRVDAVDILQRPVRQ